MSKKRLIIFCDGTWNTLETLKKRRGIKDISPVTNVVKLMHITKPYDLNTDTHQVMLYLKGIGTNGWIDKFIGGITGYGISENILSAYRFIANNFDKTCETFLFGFSRGAYTARSLSGFLNEIGMLKKEYMYLLPKAYEYYRLAPKERNETEFGKEFNEELKVAQQPEYASIPVKFIGVWDTVGALGVPLPILNHFTRRQVSFHNTDLCQNVTYAYQALALHELRSQFKPVFWTKKTNGSQQSIEQVWFAGAHSDVGGGLCDSGEYSLSDYSLLWMIEKAKNVGMSFNENEISQIQGDYKECVSLSRRLSEKGIGKFIKWSLPHIRPINPQKIDCYLKNYFPSKIIDVEVKDAIYRHLSVEDRKNGNFYTNQIEKKNSTTVELSDKDADLFKKLKPLPMIYPSQQPEEKVKASVAIGGVLEQWRPKGFTTKYFMDLYKIEPAFKIIDKESEELELCK